MEPSNELMDTIAMALERMSENPKEQPSNQVVALMFSTNILALGLSFEQLLMDDHMMAYVLDAMKDFHPPNETFASNAKMIQQRLWNGKIQPTP